jgi:excinuclease UvrABC ATPase subunit
MEIDELIPIVREINDPVAAPLVAALVERLEHVADIGLEYLS